METKKRFKIIYKYKLNLLHVLLSAVYVVPSFPCLEKNTVTEDEKVLKCKTKLFYYI